MVRERTNGTPAPFNHPGAAPTPHVNRLRVRRKVARNTRVSHMVGRNRRGRSSVSAMQAQQLQLEDILTGEGWRIVERETPCSDWWLDEVWVIESLWSPVGVRAYVSFIVDPMAPREKRKGKHVWAVAVGLERAGGVFAVGAIPLRPQWERVHVAEVHREVRRLRARA